MLKIKNLPQDIRDIAVQTAKEQGTLNPLDCTLSQAFTWEDTIEGYTAWGRAYHSEDYEDVRRANNLPVSVEYINQ